MDRVTKFKEAFKTALALVMVYGIALKLGWMNLWVPKISESSIS